MICSVPPQKIRNKCNPLDPNDKNCDWSGPLENPNNGLCGACNYPQVSLGCCLFKIEIVQKKTVIVTFDHR